jgi:outer membrane protein OmpA-like peptidoglycan-associated protein
MSVPVSSPLRRYRRRILGWGLFGVVVLCGVAAPLYLRSVERDLERRVPSELAERGFEGVSAAFSGQDGVLRCATPLAEPEEVIDAAVDVWGVRAVELDRSCRVIATTEGTDGVSTAPTDNASTAAGATGESPSDAADETVDDTVTGTSTSSSSGSTPGSTPTESSTGPGGPDPTVSDAEVAALQSEFDDLIDATPILFGPRTADVSPEGFTVLDQVAALVERFAGVAITIEGHSDSDGAPADNQTLSDSRAMAVLEGLVGRGVPRASLTAVGLGATRPVVVDGEEDKAASRRVEFRVTTQAG